MSGCCEWYAVIGAVISAVAVVLDGVESWCGVLAFSCGQMRAVMSDNVCSA